MDLYFIRILDTSNKKLNKKIIKHVQTKDISMVETSLR